MVLSYVLKRHRDHGERIEDDVLQAMFMLRTTFGQHPTTIVIDDHHVIATAPGDPHKCRPQNFTCPTAGGEGGGDGA